MRLKIFLAYTFSLIMFFVSCNTKQANRSETSNENRQLVKKDSQSPTMETNVSCLGTQLFLEPGSRYFCKDTFNYTVSRMGICYYHYKTLDKEKNLVINGYWGIKNDTFYIVKKNDIDFVTPMCIPFISRKGRKNDRYSYHAFIQSRNDFAMLSTSIIDVEILDVKYNNNDTVFVLSHTCRSLSIPDAVKDSTGKWGGIPQIVRKFTFSFKHGIIDFSEKKIGDVSELNFDWDK